MTRVSQAVELDRIHLSNGAYNANHPSEEHRMVEEIEQASLPPTDRGKEAWLVLAGCTMIQIPVWGAKPSVEFVRKCTHVLAGYSIAFGVFQEYYGSHPEQLKGDSSNVAVIGTTMTVLLSAPLLYFLKPRIPLSQSATVRRISLNFIHLPAFWMLQIGNILQSLGYFLPYAYLSTYAVQQLHVSTTIATTLLVLINVTSIPGGIVIGGLGDHLHITTTILISTLGSALAVFLFWGFSSQTALLAVFSITYGFFAGGFSSTWSGVLQELKAQSPALDTGFIFGLLAGGRGIGNVISGPLSVALVTGDGWTKDGRSWGYSGQYGGIILFTGVTALLGGWGALGRVKWTCGN
ncbi:hypothetical protein N0V91_010847 [Didymella pomorum]|uniref:Major facilitator superfamily (MFS) profile domain-containing protein n=1 Tax=Didymella pomorum TaxID=749634 RepID=A0A9W8Z0M8_9PLEO|nr:hypothetical protein N0V91_010847 [Didymella pomorum]